MMIDHVLIYVVNLDKSKLFYEKALSSLGYAIAFGKNDHFWSFNVGNGALFEIAQYKGNDKLTPCHVAFRAYNREQVNQFYVNALASGGLCNGKPGLRPQYTQNYYAAFIIDPDGHNIEAMLYLESNS